MRLLFKKDEKAAVDQLQEQKDVPGLTRMLSSRDSGVRYRVAVALSEVGDSTAVPSLIKALQDENQPVREATAVALAKLGDKSAVPPLIGILKKDQRWSMREKAAMALGRIGEDVAVGPLSEALNDSHESVRGASLRALGEIGSDAAVQALISRIKGFDRFHAILALSRLGSRAKEAVPTLIEILRDKDSNVRDVAVLALKSIGPDASDAVTILSEVAVDEEEGWDLKYGAAEALDVIRGKVDGVWSFIPFSEIKDLPLEERVVELVNRAYYVSHERKGFTLEGTPAHYWLNQCQNHLLLIADGLYERGGIPLIKEIYERVCIMSDIAARYLRVMWRDSKKRWEK